MLTLSYAKMLPITDTYDVVVCGGGPAGIGAAIAAAERGAKTVLIERFGFLGGMATAGYVNPMSEFAYNGQRISGGIPWRFAQEMVAMGAAVPALADAFLPAARLAAPVARGAAGLGVSPLPRPASVASSRFLMTI